MFSVPIPPRFGSVLLISSISEDRVSLQHIFNHSNWRLHMVSTCRDAISFTRENDTSVVICERSLPDGDWKLVLSEFDRMPLRPNLIVTSRRADDELWAEVLNLGGYDVLAQPFHSDEVYHVVSLAWQERKRRVRAWVRSEMALKTDQIRAGAA